MWLVFYLRAHKPCCPSFPLPAPSQLSRSVIILPHCCLWPSIQQPAGEVASLITFVLIGAWWEAFAFPSVLMAPQLGPWLALLFPCVWAVPGEQQMLPAPPQGTAGCYPCPVTNQLVHRASQPGHLESSTIILLPRKSPMLQNHNFLSQRKTKQLCPGLSVYSRSSPRTDSISIEKCTHISAKIAVKMCWFVGAFCLFFLIAINIASEESHIWWLRARWDFVHIELSYRGNPLQFPNQFLFNSVMGFSAQSPDHVLLLHLSLYFSVMADFVHGILFDRSTRAPYIPVIERQSLGPAPAWVGGICFPWAVLSADLAHMSPRAASSGMTLPKMVTRNWPPASCFWWPARACPPHPGCGHVFVCVCYRGKASSGLSRDCSSVILLEAGCCQGLHTHYSCNPVHPPGSFFPPVD